ncbi:hypothetical protein CTAYLR_005797 [Chrysophaeum taylorii]|uniref:Methyltransferase FkbM domain-containing protein n=1 Tax=Chrysophaeum taylorii TaxID=2483200 RepID=A0AAD7ULS6_9STRA|nr:hypothetical protein CTAYLR_005797 [Chrysophaeum taylorii]
MAVLSPSLDGVVSKWLVEKGTWDVHVLAAMSHVVMRSRPCERDDVVLDVGANLGFFGLLAWQANCHVVAFEMQPLMHKAIRTSLCLARRSTVASAGEEKERHFNLVAFPVHEIPWMKVGYRPPRLGHSSNIGGVGLAVVPCEPGASDGCHEMRTVRVDTSVDKFAHGKTVAIAKVDVEGHEFRALLSMYSLFEAERVDNVLFELNPRVQGLETAAATLHYVRSFGFRLYLLPFTYPDASLAWPSIDLEPIFDVDKFVLDVDDGRVDRQERFVDILATRQPEKLGFPSDASLPATIPAGPALTARS